MPENSKSKLERQPNTYPARDGWRQERESGEQSKGSIPTHPESQRESLRTKSKDIEPTMLFLRDELCRSLTGRGLAPGSHAGFKLLDNVLGDNFIDAWYLVGAPVLICCFQASITFSLSLRMPAESLRNALVSQVRRKEIGR